MSEGGSASERALILAPWGRDADIAASVLSQAKLPVRACKDAAELLTRLEEGGAVALVAEEALYSTDLSGIAGWVAAQPPWSDFPFVLLAQRGGGLERNPGAARLSRVLGNVIFLERPFHPTTLVSAVETALRGRRRQYEARSLMEEIRRAEAFLEDRVAERTAELEAANRQLAEQINERARVELALQRAQRLEAVGQLTSGIAHDFNNLLTVVLGNVRQLQKGQTDPATRRRLDMMAEAAQRGARLTGQMLAFSRQQKLEARPVDLNETVSRMHDLLISSMGGSVKLETNLSPDLWPAMIDPTQIELVILNLAINARDAMDVGGTLAITTANAKVGPPSRPEEPVEGEYVMLSVRDNGSGMSDEVLAKAFEPFFTTKPVGKGSGLGLSQVFGLAKQSGGGVRIDTQPGVGTSVTVYLPRARAAAAPAEASSGAPGVRHGRGAVVLLVDDDSAVREVTASILAELGYKVVEAGSGGAALELFDRRPDIALVLLDFAMPGMNGAEVARELRARRPDVPILFATGYADTAALAVLGEDELIQKPFVESEVATKLAARLEARVQREPV
jgi:signal transduction histidine kinase/ActR/RegA family two-component response regulator